MYVIYPTIPLTFLLIFRVIGGKVTIAEVVLQGNGSSKYSTWPKGKLVRKDLKRERT